MTNIAKQSVAIVALALCGLVSAQVPASALTAELAKKCRALAIKAHPPVVPGKRSGNEQAQRDYFRDCVAKEGNVDSK